ncbi:beta-lactamase family protein [Actinomadura barringtoniae]|uniref:Beta-lactamase family protein n=1 Tax=Actinomadura barringtoniae TaxID=1427535 RepID=A0A939P7L9_9ACTN|nr:serine hydrolase domain-containing protein [Actinomadura barringtoniae]MBO2447221.1 beta-lactamase family protein [Actinomadura barringtoniae]
MTKDASFEARWQARLDELRAAHHVPGAVLAFLVNGEIHELASGVLNRGTGVETTTDSVFLLGSVAKIYTATMMMQLVEEGRLDLDTPVVDVLPEFATPDPEATAVITVRQLLSHTGGLTNDFTHDTGRGDDCLAKYVEAARNVALDCPPGTAVSYSGLGYVTMGRIIEVLDGKTWDQAVQDRIVAPLGLTRTMTLPEEALRFRVAMSHLGEPGEDPDPAPVWDLMPRSAGPYGRVISSAGDVVRLARMHLNGGIAADGTRVMSSEIVSEMQRRHVNVPDKWTVSADGWALGWTLYDWDGVAGYGHDGAAIGQYSYLRVVPGSNVAVALVTNGGGARQLYADLFRELLYELAGVRMPGAFAPPEPLPAIGIAPFAGTYKREGVVITVGERDGEPRMLYEFVDGMKDMSPPLDMSLTPVSVTEDGTVFAAAGAGPSFSEDYMPVVFSTLTNGTDCVYVGMRATPKTN